MRRKIKPILFLPLVALICGATAPVAAQLASGGHNDIRLGEPYSTPVCENGDLKTQVKAALRLVCARRGSGEAPASAERLIVIGFLGGFAKNGDTRHPEVWFGTYLRELYPS